MSTYRLKRISDGFRTSLEDVPPSIGIVAAGAANAFVGVEAFRSLSFDDLPSHIVEQLRRDGTRGELRSIDEARQVYEQNVPNEAKGSVEGVESITNDPNIHWMHKEPYANGGSANATNGVYGPADLNHSIGKEAMNDVDIAEAEAFTFDIAESSTPGVTGDLAEVAGDTLETGGLGGVLGGGIAAAHRLAQVQGYRDAGREDLAQQAERQIGSDAAKGAVNGIVRGTTVAVTQAVLGANPLTAGIGLVAPDAVMLLTNKEKLSQDEYNQKALEVAGKGALATALVCAGPVGWMGLAGISIISAYDKAQKESVKSLAFNP